MLKIVATPQATPPHASQKESHKRSHISVAVVVVHTPGMACAQAACRRTTSAYMDTTSA